MAPIAFGSSADRHTPLNGLKKFDHEKLDGFGTRAVHIGSDPDPSTGAVIPAISLSTTYKQNGVGNHKVSESDRPLCRDFFSNSSFAVLGI
jgi:cystathionine gamma-lyase